MNDQSVVVSPQKAGEIIEAVIARGDLAQLNPQERAKYYSRVCESIGLNPLTKPFEYITLNGKLTLYARKDATDQLRKIYGVSVVEMTENERDGLVIVTVKVRDSSGRTDMAKGAVTLKGLQGEALANAFMKAETKAKRRATLSICGLGFLDEVEVEAISNAHSPRLPKKDARDIYSRIQAEVDEAADIEDWLLKNEGRLLVLPEDWENILRLRIQERRETPMPPMETVIWDDPPEWSGDRWDALGPVKQAGVLCSDEAFWKFLSEHDCPATNADEAAKTVRGLCNVTSRKELATSDVAASKWRLLVSNYRAWQREPSVIEDSPQPRQPASVDESAAPDTPAPAGAADDVPTAAEYIHKWLGLIDSADGPQMKKLWNDEADMRKAMEWPSGAFIDLQRKVKAAISKESAA